MASEMPIFQKISVSGDICAIGIQKTALYILEGPLESNYISETAKKEKTFWPQKHE